MPSQTLDTTANGPDADWTVVGTSGWEAVQRGSGDATIIHANNVGDTSTFVCGDGWAPPVGFISAVVLHVRARATDSGGAPVLDLLVLQDGVNQVAYTWNVADTLWHDFEIRVREDWVSAARFAAADLDNLGVGVEITTATAAGHFEVSEAWLEVETVEKAERYDPYFAALPDAVPGPLLWFTAGTQAAALTADNFLSITDASAVDYRNYYRSVLSYDENYNSEIETRLSFTSLPGAGTYAVYYLAVLEDMYRSVHLMLFIAGGVQYIGLTDSSRDHNNPAAYLATYALSFAGGVSRHLRLRINRDPEPSALGQVDVFVDYGDTPVMSVPYIDFSGFAGQVILFGSGDMTTPLAQSTALVDFVAWDHWRRTELFPGWRTTTVRTNQILPNAIDTEIVTLRTIPIAGITAGQSNQCCQLIINDPGYACFVEQFWTVMDAAHQYDLVVDYKVDTVGKQLAVTVQRTSDYYYWNTGLSAWQAALITATLPTWATRLRTTVMQDIQTATPDVLLVRISHDLMGPGAYNAYLYKVGLDT